MTGTIPKTTDKQGAIKTTQSDPIRLDEKTAKEFQEISGKLQEHLQAFIKTGVKKADVLKDANGLAGVLIHLLDRADHKEDGKITKDTLRQAVNLFNSSMSNPVLKKSLGDFKEIANLAIDHLKTKDGTISTADAKTFLANQIHDQLGKTLTLLDANKDKTISAAETLLVFADKNKNGSVSLSEALAASEKLPLKMSKVDITKSFFALDTDRNFSLSTKEIQAGLNQITESRYAHDIGSMASPSLKHSAKGTIQK